MNLHVHKRKFIAVMALSAMAIFLAGLIYSRCRSVPKPNVVIVISDALRRDHLGCYGYPRNTTPYLDSLSKRATVYKNAFAQAPSTKPSIASLFTSRYPSQHRAIYNRDALDPGYLTLAEILKDHEYRTAGFIENPKISKRFMYDQGFDIWELDDRRHKPTPEAMEEFDQKIFNWLEGNAEAPVFLYIHYIDPHIPYDPPEGFRDVFDPDYNGNVVGTFVGVRALMRNRDPSDLAHVIALYDEEIRYIDSRMKKLTDKLKQLKLWKDTLLIFTSDHGEGFFDHHSLFTHSNSVYAEEINIPLIVYYPRLFPPQRDERYVQHIDIFPTLMHILGIDAAALSLEGNDILSPADRDNAVISEHLREGRRKQRCLISGGWKLVQLINYDQFRLYNLVEDPTDSKDVAAKNSGTVDRLKARLTDWLADVRGTATPPQVELDDDMIDKLKSLGYLQ